MKVLLLAMLCGAAMAADSGLQQLSPALQAMQRDDSQNPGMLWAQQGRELWTQAPANAQACAGCHGAPGALAGAAARYPRFDAGKPLTLAAQIERCRSKRQGQVLREDELLALETLVALQSRGQPLKADTALADWQRRGEQLYRQRIGQLNLSCAQCHDDNAGRRLGGALIPPGHVAAYPQYRLEWQALGGLSRRLRNCQVGVRAEPLQGDELLALQAYLAKRSTGLPLEAPAVRP
ncbi:sulfur oxidation c-type cytochrome SoxA [Pelomonas sp. SE-A7]|uniref:sulfur oxidation c-type cytochrome SoxA n=1 Tax=Pelomonas sp. SE-A7 TaxID=3054953 RepID=UPI00259D0686|nr:sulfur oxidation c-type cytochrome SoxA [Pelomonas sp. SE-A7]MDM4767815.1 sulfur oxidation c-type cytochrome SoxA [Pelomonas sp. SE-A7]